MHPFTKNEVKKRLLNNVKILISISIVLSIFNPVFIASAASGAIASVDDLSLDVGETSYVSINIGNCSNVTALNATLSFNDNTVEFVGAIISTGVSGSLINKSSPGTVNIELTEMNQFNATGQVSVVDVIFKGIEIGSDAVSLDVVELTTPLGSEFLPDSSLNDGSITVDSEPVSNNAPEFGIISDQFVNEGEKLSLLLNASDIDDDSLTFSKNSSIGTISGHFFNWTPTSSDIGIHYINFSVNDSELSDHSVVTITVESEPVSNNAPEFGTIADQSVNEGEELSLLLNASDIDDDSLTFSKNVSIGTISGHFFNWTPTSSDIGIHYINFSVNDSELLDHSIVTITVNDVNHAPEFGIIANQFVNEAEKLSLLLNASDADDDILTFSKNVSNGSISGHFFNWTPTSSDIGTHYINFSVNDSELLDHSIVTITVNDVNHAPEFGIIADQFVNEGDELSLLLNASDIDDDLLTFSKNSSIGTISGHFFNWTPTSSDIGIHYINFSVNDSELSDHSVVTITVNDVNHAPEFVTIADQFVNEGDELSLLLNASDIDDDLLTFSKNASNGTISGHFFNWTPTYNDSGIHYIKFNVTDGIAFDSETIKITVTNVNRAPQFNHVGQQNVNEGDPLSFTVTATDADGDSLTYEVSGDPSDATTSSNSSGITLSWTPDFNEAGTYNVTFSVTDDVVEDILIVPIVVSDVNRDPEFTSLESIYTVNENATLTITLGASDPDEDDSITVWVNNSDNASGALNGGSYIWNTGYLDSGAYNIEFAVSDGKSNVTSIATVTVNDVNAPPKFEQVSSKTVEINNNVQFMINATDIYDNDPLNYSVVEGTLPTNATFDNSTLLFSWTPSDSQKGTFPVKFQVTDGDDSDYMTVSITVKDSSTSTSSSSSSSGGGGGGGGGATGEAYENIDFKDYVIKSVVKDMETVFSFVKEDNSIISVSFTTGINGGQTKAVVEMLKNTSTLASEDPSGTVYKNMNIWMGDGKFLPELISDAKIVFKVEKSWIDDNDIDPDSVKLLRHSGSQWTQLPTSRTSENDEYFYYVAETPGFSPFAISSVEEETVGVQASDEKAESISEDNDVKNSVDEMVTQESNIANQDEKSTGFIPFVLILLGAVFIGLLGYNKRNYCEQYYERIRMNLGNPDGKRYRRVKR
ncbi:PGF-pre-PGF domain-containing protein [Methanolobus sp. ZRKC2]|uniref:PGF-pre-PGF domain-containing protein n=1 Tax=Methanolobus sp. ZRKC2 TaxID=3125783 RepID=UPI003247F442